MREQQALRKVGFVLQEIEETLAAGLVPARSRWDSLRGLPAPWGALVFESLQELRNTGGALVPTLKRLRALALEQDVALSQAKARTAQSLAQALLCAALVPVFGGVLYYLLPAVAQNQGLWLCICATALLLAGVGAVWLLKMAEAARWGGLRSSSRAWVLASQCAGERFLAWVRAGNPPDLAWARTIAALEGEVPALVARWGASIWSTGQPVSKGAERPVEEAGHAIRRAIQVSLMEGRPCTERVEVVLESLRQDLRAGVERELGLLATRALKPLFVCVAPALLGLLGCGLWVSWNDVAGGMGGF
ncbi:hypothetical protein WDW37_13510 [Bdellovibrionota bacterium FG-1]